MATPTIDDEKEKALKEQLESINQIQRKQSLSVKSEVEITGKLSQRPEISNQSTITQKSNNRRVGELERQFSFERPNSQSKRQNEVDELEQMYILPSPPEQERVDLPHTDEENQTQPEEDQGDMQEQQDNQDHVNQLRRLRNLQKSQEAAAATEGAAGAVSTATTAAEGAEATAATVGFIAANMWWLGPFLGFLAVLGLIFGLFLFVTVTTISYCNSNSATGWIVWGVSKIGGEDFCKTLAINTSSTVSPPTVFTPPTTPPGPGIGLTDAQARAQLAAAAISVNAPEPQTSLAGINSSVIGEVIAFKNACGSSCNVIVTGGTETTGGHAGGPCSHLSGNKIDIDDVSTVNSYILANFIRVGTRSDGATLYRNPNTNVIYARESNHWDIGGIGCA